MKMFNEDLQFTIEGSDTYSSNHAGVTSGKLKSGKHVAEISLNFNTKHKQALLDFSDYILGIHGMDDNKIDYDYLRDYYFISTYTIEPFFWSKRLGVKNFWDLIPLVNREFCNTIEYISIKNVKTNECYFEFRRNYSKTEVEYGWNISAMKEKIKKDINGWGKLNPKK